MKKFFLSYGLSILGLTATFAQQALPAAVPDSTREDISTENRLIDEVVKSGKLPQKEKVQYFSQVTRYGFKNLFSNSSYNSTQPYINQVNPNAELFIQDYIKGHSRYLLNMKDWGQPYFNLIENILVQYGLPKELKYIAVIESNLSTAATSPVGAGGPWQFMPGTARTYGLLVNSVTDDRRDYYKSTHAAARYLLTLYRQLHDWLLVMAAYNGGPGRVYGAMKKSGSKNFWSLQYYLPEESRTYVKRFIATHYIMEGGGGITTTGGNGAGYTENGTGAYHQNNKLSPEEISTLETILVSGKYNSVVIAKNLSMDLSAFSHYNPDFDAVLATGGNYEMRLPAEKMQLFVANKYDILNECVAVLLGGATVPATKTVYPVKPKQPKK